VAKDLRLDVVTDSDPKGLLSTAAEIDRLAGKTDKLGRDFDETAVEGAFLAKELEAVKLKAAALARQFDETGDRAILKQISRNQSYEKQLQRVGKALEDVGKDTGKVAQEGFKAGTAAGNGFIGGFSQTLADNSSTGVAIKVGLVTAAAAAAPVAGAMIGGAILAGIGAAGIGGGIALALKNPQVKQAAEGLKETIGNELKDAATPFIVPALKAFHEVETAFSGEIAPGIADTFRALAPEVETVAHGVTEFVKEAAAGFEKAAVAAKPLLDDLGNSELPQLGRDVGDLFSTIADNAPMAEKGLQVLFQAIHDTIVVVDTGINVFSSLFGVIEQGFIGILAKARDFVDALSITARALHLPHDSLDKASASLDRLVAGGNDFLHGLHEQPAAWDAAGSAASDYVSTVNLAAAKTRALNLQWEALDKNLTSDQAINSAKDAIAGIGAQLDKTNHSLDQNSVKGRANREVYESAIQTLEQQRDQLVENGMSASDADKKFQGWVKALDKAAEKAGLDKTAIKELNKQLGLIPNVVPVKIKITHTGDSQVMVTGTGIKFFAAGGRYKAGEPRIVGENGPEFDIPDHSGVIVPNGARSSAMPGSGTGGGSGGGDIAILGFDARGDQVMETLFAAMRPVIRRRYGGSVTRTLGSA